METDLFGNDWPICPYCFYKDEHAWEYDLGGIEGSGDVDCPSCGMPYNLVRRIDIYYDTYKLGEE